MKFYHRAEAPVMIFFVLLGMTMPNCATDVTKPQDLVPEKALVILTRESMGCLNKQTLIQEASDLVARDDGKAVTLHEIKNPEDVSNRNELYLLFPAQSVAQLSGFFVLKFWCDSDQPEPASLSVDHAAMRRRGNDWSFALEIKSDGFVHAQMLYSRRPEFTTAAFTYPEADVREPMQVTFYRAYPLEGELGGVPSQKLADKWQTLELRVNPFSLEVASFVDACERLLEEMDKNFAPRGATLVWQSEKVKAETLRSLASTAATGKATLHVVLKLDDGRVIKTNEDNFVPHLRQKLVLKTADGKLIGAELWLRAESS